MHPAIWFIPAGMLGLALLPLPYGYFVFLRIVVCGGTAFLAWQHNTRIGLGVWVFTLGGLAILFNPLIPIHLTKQIWAVLDVGAAAILVVHFITNRKALRAL